MSTSHQQFGLGFDSIYLSRIDPIRRKQFEVGEIVILCARSGEVLSRASLEASGGRCPYCGESIGKPPRPARTEPSAPGKSADGKAEKVISPAMSTRKSLPLWVASAAALGIICVAFAFIAGSIYLVSTALLPTQTARVQTTIDLVPPSPSIRSTATALSPTITPGLKEPTSTVAQPAPEAFRVNAIDSENLVFISSGQFIMGSNPDKPFFWGAEAPEHNVNLKSFWIYQTEVTQGMYQLCVGKKSCPLPVKINHPVALQYGNPRFEDYPVVMVTWQDAVAYCEWAGARLPTEAEWEKAARGTDDRLFPWGNSQDADGLANYSSSSPSAVGSYPLGASPYGLYDMAGNVLEWVQDYFAPLYYQYSPLDDPKGPASGERRVIRGGSFNQSEIAGLRTTARASLKPGDTQISVGFRCAMDEP